MILKGSQRSGGRQLAAHLLRADENEHVELHELRGFMADNLHDAFQEAYAISKGTRAKQYLFSLSLNPPPNEQVPIEVFESAVEDIEQRLGLEGQPRAIVFHEKEGRRHAHAVWSRIDIDEMKAINLPHFKLKLKDVAKELYLEHGWDMPRGFVDKNERDPLNFSREEWQQALRTNQDPKALKKTFQDCWSISDSRQAYEQALLSRGLALARGDRRGYVAVDTEGEIYAIAKYTGIRTKKVKAKLGEPDALPSIEQAKAKLAAQISNKVRDTLQAARKDQKAQRAVLAFERTELVQRQREERKKLDSAQSQRWDAESRERAQRLAKGLRGIWHRLSGKYARVKRQNELESLKALQRDSAEKDALIFRHIDERQKLQKRIQDQRRNHSLELREIRREIFQQQKMRSEKSSHLQKAFEKASTGRRNRLKKERKRDRDSGFEPEL